MGDETRPDVTAGMDGLGPLTGDMPATWGQEDREITLHGSLADWVHVSVRTFVNPDTGERMNTNVLVSLDVEDFDNPGTKTRIYSKGFKSTWHDLTEPLSDRDLALLVRDAILDALSHEVSEAIRVDGVCVLDPHDGETRMPESVLVQQLKSKLDEARREAERWRSDACRRVGLKSRSRLLPWEVSDE